MSSLTSRIDFSTTCARSSMLHILVTAIGSINEDFLHSLTVELGKVPLPNSKNLAVRYVLQTTPLLTDWSDVQYYRHHVGLLCVAVVEDSSDPNLTTILPNYNRIKRRQETTVIDSKCIIFSKEHLTLPNDYLRPDIMGIMFKGDAESIHGEELTAMIGGFAQGLYTVIVRNTIEFGNEKYNANSNVQLLYSPYERSKSGLEDGKVGKRRIQGRHRKHLGDLFMLTGKAERALEAYDESYKILSGIGDTLWVGAIYEAQACAIAHLLREEKGGSSSSGFSKNERHRSSQESLNSISSEPEVRSEENIILKFRSALNAMDKIPNASYIMLECSLKYIRLMVDFKNKNEVNEILTNDIIRGNIDLLPVERVQLLCTIAKTYKDIGMIRKYCYYLRRAAIESMNDRLLSRAYALSSSLFCEIIERYGVVPAELRATGWARLQKRALEDLISTSEKLANSDVVVKYGMCLLQNFHMYLSPEDQLRILNLVGKCYTRLGEITIETTTIPSCKKTIVKQNDKFLEPKRKFKSDSIFIFAPKTTKEKEQPPEIWWVCNEFGEIQLKLENPLQHPLKLSNIRCEMEGTDFDSYPGKITIDAKQTVDLVLSVKPLSATENLKLTRIHFNMEGVPCFFQVEIDCIIKVAPAMPLLSIQGVIPAQLNLYEGQLTRFTCTLINNSGYTINNIDIIENKCSSRFSYQALPEELKPNACTDFIVDVDTKVRQDERCKCFEVEDRSGYMMRPRRGTIYENSSEDEEDGGGIPSYKNSRPYEIRTRYKSPSQVFIEDMFFVSLRYYDKSKEYYRDTEIQFNIQILLLYRLDEYRIFSHPTDSSLCKWYLAFSSICPERMSMVIGGDKHFVDPGCRVTTTKTLPRIPPPPDVPTAPHKIKHCDLLDDACVLIEWSIRDYTGVIDLMEAVSILDLTNVFIEDILMRAEVVDQIADREENGRDVYRISPCIPIDIKVTITNVSMKPKKDLFQYVRVYHESQKPTRSLYDVPFVGSRDFEVETLDPEESRDHVFSILPLTSGTFYLDIESCEIPAKSPLTSCTIQYNPERPESSRSYEDDVIVPRKYIIQSLNEGNVPAYVKSWKMRPNIFFDILSE